MNSVGAEGDSRESVVSPVQSLRLPSAGAVGSSQGRRFLCVPGPAVARGAVSCPP